MKNPKNLLIQDFQQVGNIGLPINNQPIYIPSSVFYDASSCIVMTKQGPDYLPEGFVACNSHDLIQVRGEK